MNDQRVGDILDHAADLPVDERAAYLDQACGGDAELRSEVESLLIALDGPDPLANPTTAPIEDGLPADRQIGPYKLLQVIGEGGFGVVYMAEQQTPVRRKVALKIIKLGMDTKEVVARFEAERQALALMDHPNIARVLDAGATESGRPFFVMELVNGVPITAYCDNAKLTTRQRLEIMIPVCRAVQSAHQKGVIHRDLKPSNVLVTLHDGKPVPKVIDFGIAKATGQALTDKTLFTRLHQFIGTPVYMSPEQAEMTGLDIDTRADVYGLGVMIYELLTGSTPFDAQTLRRAAYEQMCKIIRETEPDKPSTKLTGLGNTLEVIAACRSTDPRGLSAVVRGELDWIVMKSLEKDRTRRYDTAAALADDLNRYLTGEPVAAGPPGGWYRLRKTARRYKGPLAIAAAIGVALLLGVVGTTWMGIRAEKRRVEAVNERNRSDSILRFLALDVLQKASHQEMDKTTRQQLLKLVYEPALAELGQRLHDQPETEAAIRSSLYESLLMLHRPDLALIQAETARSLLREHLGDGNVKTLAARQMYAKALAGRNQTDAALEEFAEVADLSEKVFGKGEANTLMARADYVKFLADAHPDRRSEAEPVLRVCAEQYAVRCGPQDFDGIMLLGDYVSLLTKMGRYDQAISYAQQLWNRSQTRWGDKGSFTIGAKNQYDDLLKRSTAVPATTQLTTAPTTRPDGRQ